MTATKRRRKPAKPTLKTPAKREELLEHVRNGMRPGAAAEVMGFPRSALYELLADDPDYAEMVEKAEREATEHVEEALYQAAVSGNVTAARIWLERSEKPTGVALVAPTGPEVDRELEEINAIARGDA